ncbi:osmolarity sensor protein EnvZ [mine drainage metagenome]|uniref:histidine kinase n=1 Tax=mine drainage metagenome TaxID=410659 RepID=A0A1J5SQ35_9ZZZZ
MAGLSRGLLRLIKARLPKGLLGRSLLILVTPLVLLQLVSAYVFYGTHWDMVTRRLSTGLAGDIGTVADLLRLYPGRANREAIFTTAGWRMGAEFGLEEGGILKRTGMLGAASPLETLLTGYSLEANLMGAMAERLGRPVFIDTVHSERSILINVQLRDGVLTVRVSRKRLYSPTTTIFVLWMVGTSMLLFGIATLFMRNQVRAVRRLAAAADSFGKGLDVPNFRAEGAAEVRQAAAAFTLMRDRLKRQVAQRTEMLAGVSHDLRTPLTRMKLQLAMMEGEGVADLAEDVADMERMVEGYLAFARGEGTEKAEHTDLVALLEDVAAKLRREGAAVDLHCEEEISLLCRPHAMARTLMNLAGNAVRYARHVAIRAGRRADGVEVIIDDDGPGIPADKREEVFKAFVRLESSRNPQTGGVGLGLTIARDLVRSHGGELALEDSPLGGLRVRLRLPL